MEPHPLPRAVTSFVPKVQSNKTIGKALLFAGRQLLRLWRREAFFGLVFATKPALTVTRCEDNAAG